MRCTLGLQNVVRSSKYPINHVITSQRWETLLILTNHLSDLHNNYCCDYFTSELFYDTSDAA